MGRWIIKDSVMWGALSVNVRQCWHAGNCDNWYHLWTGSWKVDGKWLHNHRDAKVRFSLVQGGPVQVWKGFEPWTELFLYRNFFDCYLKKEKSNTGARGWVCRSFTVLPFCWHDIDMLVLCIDMDIQNFSNLSLIKTTEIKSISLVTTEDLTLCLSVSIKIIRVRLAKLLSW